MACKRCQPCAGAQLQARYFAAWHAAQWLQLPASRHNRGNIHHQCTERAQCGKPTPKLTIEQPKDRVGESLYEQAKQHHRHARQ